MQAQCPLHGGAAPVTRRVSTAHQKHRGRQHSACRAAADAADAHSSRRPCKAQQQQARLQQSSETAQSSRLAAVPAFLAGTISSLTSLGGNGGGRGGAGSDGSSGGGGDGGIGPGTEDVGFAHGSEEDRCVTAGLSCPALLAAQQHCWSHSVHQCQRSYLM